MVTDQIYRWLKALPNLRGPSGDTGSIRAWTWLLLVVISAGLIGATVGWWVQDDVRQEYRSAAVFSVEGIAPDMTFLSLNKTVEAEQVMDVLKTGPAKQLAATAAPEQARYTTTWVVGPKRGEVSFQVSSENAKLSHRLATAVYQSAGPVGRALLRPEGPRPTLKPEEVTAATFRYTTGTGVIAMTAAISAGVAAGVYMICALALTGRGREVGSARPARNSS